MKKYKLNNTYTQNDLIKISKEIGKESRKYKYSSTLLDKMDKLKDDEIIFNLSFDLEGAIVHCFFKKNIRTEKETFINEITFTI